MKGYNLPDSTGPNDPEAIWNQTREPIQDEDSIREALDYVDELTTSLIFLDRRIFPKTHFPGAYPVLAKIERKLKEMLEEE